MPSNEPVVNLLPGTSSAPLIAETSTTSTTACTTSTTPLPDASAMDLHCAPSQAHSQHTTSSSSAPNFDCGICLDVCYDPVVTMCGHLFCWPCLYHWLSLHSVSQECPICKNHVQQSRVIPLYGHGKVAGSELLAERFPGVCIPHRPAPTSYGSDSAQMNHRSAYHAPSLNSGVWHALLQAFMSLLPSWLSSQGTAGIRVLTHRRRYRNEKEFVLHWGFIVFALLATLAYVLC
ncbi:hypothetical protein L7F22_055870 [Adiantum nelumboides]|nr:hypothetical protein [Adiantum nelumboides]